MSKNPFFLVVVYSFFLLAGRVYGIGETVLNFGVGGAFAASWEVMEKRQGIIEAAMIRPNPVLVLDGSSSGGNSVDLALSFDEGRPGSYADSRGRYDVFVSPELNAAPTSRKGSGAALFGGTGKTENDPLVLRPRKTALFTPGSRVRDFSIEFWLYPQSIENGAQIMSWNASKPENRGGYTHQYIQCVLSKNRIQWNFGDFFFSPGNETGMSLTLSGPPLLPRAWSHHLVRFDADLGLLEYLVDGRVEALDYTTASGREGGEVYTPVIGNDSRIALGGRFSGMMDEFRVYSSYLDSPALTKYPAGGGRIETRTLDLGKANSRILKIEAFGGRSSGALGKIQNEYTGNRAFSFQDHSAINFFIRASNSPYRWNDVPWVPVNPGTELRERGRYVQIAADFYPSGDGETSPYLSELRVIYRAADPPPPPAMVTAAAGDGAVELTWKASASREAGGYLVYFGTAKGEYFGDRGILKSPIDVGNRTSVRIEGLSNGTLYYFAIAAYGKPEPSYDGMRMVLPEPGEFSRELAARPLLSPPEDG